MQRSFVLPLPGNWTKEQSFYDQNTQPIMPGVEWPGSSAESLGSEVAVITAPSPRPFKITGGR